MEVSVDGVENAKVKRPQRATGIPDYDNEDAIKRKTKERSVMN
jgi:hypothetical protein